MTQFRRERKQQYTGTAGGIGVNGSTGAVSRIGANRRTVTLKKRIGRKGKKKKEKEEREKERRKRKRKKNEKEEIIDKKEGVLE